jgi:hypothetical protein
MQFTFDAAVLQPSHVVDLMGEEGGESVFNQTITNGLRQGGLNFVGLIRLDFSFISRVIS